MPTRAVSRDHQRTSAPTPPRIHWSSLESAPPTAAGRAPVICRLEDVLDAQRESSKPSREMLGRNAAPGESSPQRQRGRVLRRIKALTRLPIQNRLGARRARYGNTAPHPPYATSSAPRTAPSRPLCPSRLNPNESFCAAAGRDRRRTGPGARHASVTRPSQERATAPSGRSEAEEKRALPTGREAKRRPGADGFGRGPRRRVTPAAPSRARRGGKSCARPCCA